ncbi:MAG: CARDB domain-containing protein [Thermoplasmata archaeon]|nr:CARDB domain-containing protein [Thermoplasmata archaeon]
MKSKALAVFALAAMLVVMTVPVNDAEAFNNVTGDSVIATGEDATYDIMYSNHDYDGYTDMTMSISYTAALKDSTGSSVSSGVDPTSGTLTNGATATLTVTAPSTAGTYTLEVSYEIEITYVSSGTEEESETVEVDLTDSREFTITVVEPIELSVTVTNNSDIDLTGFGVYFYVNGEKLEDSYTTFDLAKEGTATVTYDWVTTASNGQYTFSIQAADSGNLIQISGLGDEYTFYIGDSDYTVWIALLVMVVIILALVMVWVYRKPVKNYGKPKSRR